MKWLQEYIDPGIPATELAHRLTMAGLEAESITQIGEMWADKVFVGYVHAVARHPDADRLVLADVSAGEHRLTVVTGAPNIAAQQKVALALAGARLYDGHSESPNPEIKTLKPGTIRGIKSEGMVCSEKELGLSDEHEGILILPSDAPEGTLLVSYLGDAVIEFEITPNLAHNFSISGIAREVHALLDRPVIQQPAINLAEIPPAPNDVVTIVDPERCHRYAVLLVDNLAVSPSPAWVQQRLDAIGMRSINTIVDITNLVMHELGYPMHAFDRDMLEGGQIIVRPARDDEKVTTIDHIERALTPAMTVIADASKPVGLAGIMGGVYAESTEQTTRLLLEVAHFNPTTTRATSRALKLRTDASGRYERGVDPEGIPAAIARAAYLIRELCPGAVFSGIADVYPVQPTQRSITFAYDRVERLLGISIDSAEATAILERLGFLTTLTDGQLTVWPPSWRTDVIHREDVIEEIARIAGYERLPATLPSGSAQHVWRDQMYRLRKAARTALVATGFNEAVTYLTISDADLATFSDQELVGMVVTAPDDRVIRLRNALQTDVNILRPTLIPSLLRIASENLRHEPSIRFAELARVYLPSDCDVLPQEPELIGLVAAGRREPFGLDADDDMLDFRDLKGTIEHLLRTLGLPSWSTERWTHPAFHPGRSASLSVDDVIIARFGELHPNVSTAYGIDDTRVLAAEISLTALLSLIPARGRDAVVPRSLPVQQDFAVVIDATIPAADVEAAFRQAAGPLLTAIVLFDRYQGTQIETGKVSQTWRLTFTAPDRTLTDDDIARIRPRIEKSLRQRVNGALRV
ncbi:MAG TPA: phenylalanine--tRNA ligase subunit beta [Thermomicrobiales bacterium]|nr:phenylalanine--tRNA ligase subunit beta [Thermomicrobiales bacterium]